MLKKSFISLLLIILLIVSIIKINIKDTNIALAQTQLEPYKRKRPITITNNTTSTLTDYQVLVNLNTASLITANKMRSDCGDLRFTDSDGITLLNYYLESGCDTTSTKLWVKVPSIPVGTQTIYLYYGNPNATSTSNGDAVFDFFDDFEGTEINTAKWNIVEGTGFSVSNGELRGTDTRGRLLSVQTFSPPIIQELKMRISLAPRVFGFPGSFSPGGFYASPTEFFSFLIPGQAVARTYAGYRRVNASLGQFVPVDNTPLLIRFTLATPPPPPPRLPPAWVEVWRTTYRAIFTAIRLDTGVTTYRTLVPSIAVITISKAHHVIIGREPFYSVLMPRWFELVDTKYNAHWDWIRIRKFAFPEPTTSVGEETRVLPL